MLAFFSWCMTTLGPSSSDVSRVTKVEDEDHCMAYSQLVRLIKGGLHPDTPDSFLRVNIKRMTTETSEQMNPRR